MHEARARTLVLSAFGLKTLKIAQHHYMQIFRGKFTTNKTIHMEGRRKISGLWFRLRPFAQTVHLINFCEHVLHRILSKSDKKCRE